ncbi:hypothetical protein SS50377_21093 [Spironucleus salmonicida]|uniref:Uncharacterized protein n=1 Tax=Spironucleus salmonicida TaxID=348837 RepID=A0A9P8M038_9EUKA|nr:hypothetical protein SS50377_21093 [Spironucleus salmonicida]
MEFVEFDSAVLFFEDERTFTPVYDTFNLSTQFFEELYE